jgi:hypothetical protein
MGGTNVGHTYSSWTPECIMHGTDISHTIWNTAVCKEPACSPACMYKSSLTPSFICMPTIQSARTCACN